MQEVLMKSFDVIVVGAGHNGLAASIKLAKTGRKVLLLETSSEPGGLAASKEVFNGFKTATLPHIINQLSSKAIRELDLLKYGLETKNYSIPTICIDHSGRYIQLSGNYGSEIEGISSLDQKNWINLKKRLTYQSSLLKRFIYDSPINKDNNKLLQKLKFLKAGIDLRLKGREEFQEFFRMVLMCVADVLEEEINNDLLKGLLSFDATLGINLGPRSPTSLMGLLYKLSGEVNGEQSSQIFPKGGIEKLVDTFYKSAIGSGVKIIFDQEVKNLIIENNKIQGVKTINGKEYRANKVLSSVSPIKTFFEFIGHKKLDTGVLRELKSLRYKGNVSKLNLALDQKPVSSFLDNQCLNSRIVYAPSINHVEKKFNPSKYKELPEDPCFEILFPSIIDDDLAPKKITTASIIIQNTPYDLKAGWEKSKEILYNSILTRLDSLFPGLKKSIIASQFLSPVDIESQFNVPGGHWHHSELQIDRLYSLRPIFKYSNYKTSIKNLYICGAGTHPGGGISGNPGINAANQIIVDEK